MGHLRARMSGPAEEEAGWTLVEMLVATAAALVLIGVATTVFTAAIQSQPRATSRGNDIQQARTAMERMTRELRQGFGVPTATSSTLSILTYVKSATCGGAPSNAAMACRVTYTCGTTSCSRQEFNTNGTGGGPVRTVVSGITGPNVFSYSPSAAAPTYVGVTLPYRASSTEDAITLQDGVALRNPGVAP